MMTYKIEKQLKKAGFPWLEEYDRGAEPTLSELIEACGNNFGHLEKHIKSNSWGAYSKNGLDTTGKTPEEAVAKLWLELNKK